MEILNQTSRNLWVCVGGGGGGRREGGWQPLDLGIHLSVQREARTNYSEYLLALSGLEVSSLFWVQGNEWHNKSMHNFNRFASL